MKIQDTGRILIHGLFRRKRMIIGLNLGLLATVLIGSLLWPPGYEASSSIIIRGRTYQDALFQEGRKEQPWTVLMNPKDEINSEIEIIRSRPVFERTVEALGLDRPREIPEKGVAGAIRGLLRTVLKTTELGLKDAGLMHTPTEQEAFEGAVERLGRKIEIDPAVESQIIRVSYRDRDPVLVSQVVNKVVEEYLHQHLSINLNRTESSFYSEQITQVERDHKVLQTELVDLKARIGIVSLSKQSKALFDKLNTFDVARTTVQKEIISKRSKVEKIRQVREAQPDLLIPLPEIAQDFQVQDLENKLINLRYELSTVIDRYTEQSIQVTTARRQYKEVEEQIRRHVDHLLDREMVELGKLQAEEQALSQTVDGLKAEIELLPAKEVALSNLVKQIEDNEAVLSILRKKYQDSLIAQATDARLENAKVVSNASMPLKPATPYLLLNMVLALVLSIVVSFSMVFFLEYLDDSLRMPEDIEQNLGFQVLCSIPEL